MIRLVQDNITNKYAIQITYGHHDGIIFEVTKYNPYNKKYKINILDYGDHSKLDTLSKRFRERITRIIDALTHNELQKLGLV